MVILDEVQSLGEGWQGWEGAFPACKGCRVAGAEEQCDTGWYLHFHS